MSDRPILFSAPMIRALLDGRKTQTRRVVKVNDHLADHTFTGEVVHYYGDRRLGMAVKGSTLVQPIPYAPGDRLWVRESIARQETDQGVGYQTYAACGSKVQPLTKWYHQRKSIPSIHMPRWASRLTLTVTDARVQRLQEISVDDAIAEGRPQGGAFLSARHWFHQLWNSLHGPDAWDANPWVVALTFDVHRRNIDQMGDPA